MGDDRRCINSEEIAPATYRIPQEGEMKSAGLAYRHSDLIHDMEIDKPSIKSRRVAQLFGIVGHSIAMPDIHWGMGFRSGESPALISRRG